MIHWLRASTRPRVLPTASPTRCSVPLAWLLAIASGCGGGGSSDAGSGESSGTEASTGASSTTSAETTTELPQTTSGTSTGLDDTGTSSSGGSSTDTGSTSTEAGTSTDGTTGGSSTDGSTGSGSTDSGSTGGESSSSGGEVFVCPPGGGDPCMGPGDCASNACFDAGPLGGVCSECDEDADCAMGCSPGNPLTGACGFCCDGSLGCGCESVAACQAGLACAPILSVPGILETLACSECIIDAGCPAGQLCSPDYQLEGLIGQKVCVAPGSKALGEGCDLDGSGDAQCASGQCAVASAVGIEVMGVCAECNEDADCPPGGFCQLPTIDLATFAVTPGGCA